MDEYFELLRAIERLHKHLDQFEAHINRRLNDMDADLQAIIDSTHRSEGVTDSVLTLVSGIVAKLEATATSTIDPATKATLHSLAAELDAESDKVVAAVEANPLPVPGDVNTPPNTTVPPPAPATPIAGAPIAAGDQPGASKLPQ